MTPLELVVDRVQRGPVVTAEAITLAVLTYLGELIEARGHRFRDMTPEQQYLIAKWVKCAACGAEVHDPCLDRRTNELTPVAKPHLERLREAYPITHIRQLTGLGFPEDWPVNHGSR